MNVVVCKLSSKFTAYDLIRSCIAQKISIFTVQEIDQQIFENFHSTVFVPCFGTKDQVSTEFALKLSYDLGRNLREEFL